MTDKDEEHIQDVKNIIEHGTEEERFEYVLGNTISMCGILNICPHCLSESLMEFYEYSEKMTENTTQNTQH